MKGATCKMKWWCFLILWKFKLQIYSPFLKRNHSCQCRPGWRSAWCHLLSAGVRVSINYVNDYIIILIVQPGLFITTITRSCLLLIFCNHYFLFCQHLIAVSPTSASFFSSAFFQPHSFSSPIMSCVFFFSHDCRHLSYRIYHIIFNNQS